MTTWLPILNGRAQAFRFVAGQPTPPIARVHWKEEPAMNYTASGGIIEDGFQKTTIEPGDVLIRLPSGRVVVWPRADIGALLDGMELEDVTECITRRAM